MLPLVLVCRQDIELGAIGVHYEFAVQSSKRRQADQCGGRRERHRQTRARAILLRAIPRGHGGSNIVKGGWVVESTPGFTTSTLL